MADGIIQGSLADNPICGVVWISDIHMDGAIFGRPLVEKWAAPTLERDGHMYLTLGFEMRVSDTPADRTECAQALPRTRPGLSPHSLGLPDLQVGDVLFVTGYAAKYELPADCNTQVPRTNLYLELFDPRIGGHVDDVGIANVVVPYILRTREITTFEAIEESGLYLNAQRNLALQQTNDCLFYVVREPSATPRMVGEVVRHRGIYLFDAITQNGTEISYENTLGMELPHVSGLYVVKSGQLVQDRHSWGELLQASPKPATSEDLAFFGVTMTDIKAQIERTGWVVVPSEIEDAEAFQYWLQTEPLIEARAQKIRPAL